MNHVFLTDLGVFPGPGDQRLEVTVVTNTRNNNGESRIPKIERMKRMKTTADGAATTHDERLIMTRIYRF